MSNFHRHSIDDTHSHSETNKSNINISFENRHNHKQKDDSHLKNIKKLKNVLILIFAFSFIELIGALYTHSLALLADFSHMLTDSLSLLIAIFMASLSLKPANKKFSYGHGRADTIGALINSIFMFSIILFIFYEGICRIIHPSNVDGKGVIIIAIIGFIINLISFKILHSGHEHNSLNNKAALIHVIGDLLGSFIAIIAGISIYFTGISIIDPILSILVSFIMLIPTINIFISSTKIFMEGVPDQISFDSVGRTIETINKVSSVHDLHIWTMDSNNIALTAHVIIPEMQYWDVVLQEIQSKLLTEYNISHVTIQPEKNIKGV